MRPSALSAITAPHWHGPAGRNIGSAMLRRLDRFLSYEMKVSEFLGTLVIIGIPYGLVGVVWSLTHTSHLGDLHGVDLVISFLGSIVCWPVLIFANVTMT